EPQELAVTEQVALGDRDVADHAFCRRVAGTEREFARRLFDEIDVENDPVRGRAWAALHVHGLEEAEGVKALLGTVDKQRIVGVALSEAELAPDHVILRAQVPVDVDTLDVDAWPLVHDVGERNRARRRIRHGARAHAGESEALLSGSK